MVVREIANAFAHGLAIVDHFRKPLLYPAELRGQLSSEKADLGDPRHRSLVRHGSRIKTPASQNLGTCPRWRTYCRVHIRPDAFE